MFILIISVIFFCIFETVFKLGQGAIIEYEEKKMSLEHEIRPPVRSKMKKKSSAPKVIHKLFLIIWILKICDPTLEIEKHPKKL